MSGKRIPPQKTPKKKPRHKTAGFIEIPGLHGVRVVPVGEQFKLELRHKLGMPRTTFGRLVNVSVRTIAKVESDKEQVEKLQRNYLEVKRLCDSLSEVISTKSLGNWFNVPNDAFGGLKPIEVIEHGEIDRLWEMFYRLRSGMPT
ncbi:MAG: hypothetical protein P8M30_08190 [Planctomycetaceae bacterium]|jgi:DNA-binding XRE family transcriptional regulator|nr:hypothetical protein [Planctomycetaceae bacterium]MDC0307705.1 hypothetical protein [Planctomycetaceae bacterium]MDG2389285.1 hypothetical protein [Planctomycetaceae bacterium]